MQKKSEILFFKSFSWRVSIRTGFNHSNFSKEIQSLFKLIYSSLYNDKKNGSNLGVSILWRETRWLEKILLNHNICQRHYLRVDRRFEGTMNVFIFFLNFFLKSWNDYFKKWKCSVLIHLVVVVRIDCDDQNVTRWGHQPHL